MPGAVWLQEITLCPLRRIETLGSGVVELGMLTLLHRKLDEGKWGFDRCWS